MLSLYLCLLLLTWNPTILSQQTVFPLRLHCGKISNIYRNREDIIINPYVPTTELQQLSVQGQFWFKLYLHFSTLPPPHILDYFCNMQNFPPKFLV